MATRSPLQRAASATARASEQIRIGAAVPAYGSGRRVRWTRTKSADVTWRLCGTSTRTYGSGGSAATPCRSNATRPLKAAPGPAYRQAATQRCRLLR
jgi:hypothetical protein